MTSPSECSHLTYNLARALSIWQYTMYKLLTVHPTGLNVCTLCTLFMEHSRMFQNPNHSKEPSANSLKCTTLSLQPSAYSLQLAAFSLQPSAYSLQLTAYSFQPSAFSLQPTAFSIVEHQIICFASNYLLCPDWSIRCLEKEKEEEEENSHLLITPLLTKGAMMKSAVKRSRNCNENQLRL